MIRRWSSILSISLAIHGAAFAAPISVIAAQLVIRPASPRRNWRACIMDFRIVSDNTILIEATMNAG